MDSFNNTPRKEDLVGKHDSKDIIAKFKLLSKEILQDLDSKYLNNSGLDFEQCFSESYLDALTEEQRIELSSLNGELNLNQTAKVSNEKTLKEIVRVLNS